jgi:hypothetical protein
MKSKDPNIVYTCKVPITVSAEEHAIEIRRAINLAVVGEVNVNEYNDAGVIVPKNYPTDKSKILKDAHYGIMRSQSIYVEFDVTDHGEFINFRVPK